MVHSGTKLLVKDQTFALDCLYSNPGNVIADFEVLYKFLFLPVKYFLIRNRKENSDLEWFERYSASTYKKLEMASDPW